MILFYFAQRKSEPMVKTKNIKKKNDFSSNIRRVFEKLIRYTHTFQNSPDTLEFHDNTPKCP